MMVESSLFLWSFKLETKKISNDGSGFAIPHENIRSQLVPNTRVASFLCRPHPFYLLGASRDQFLNQLLVLEITV